MRNTMSHTFISLSFIHNLGHTEKDFTNFVLAAILANIQMCKLDIVGLLLNEKKIGFRVFSKYQ